MISNNNKNYQISSNTWLLIVANLLTIFFFVYSGGSLMQVLWTYWIQGMVIGVVNVFRIMRLPVRGLAKSKGINVSQKVSSAGRFILAAAFIIRYGSYQLAYLFFLIWFTTSDRMIINDKQVVNHLNDHAVSLFAVLAAGAVFAVHHIQSYKNEAKLITIKNSVNDIAQPFTRILPMNITIFAAVYFVEQNSNSAVKVFVVFMVAKTIIDVLLHLKGTSHRFIMASLKATN